MGVLGRKRPWYFQVGLLSPKKLGNQAESVCVTSCCDIQIIIQAMYYNVTLRAVRATNVAVENQLVLHILSVRL
jgi:hypothetical protein